MFLLIDLFLVWFILVSKTASSGVCTIVGRNSICWLIFFTISPFTYIVFPWRSPFTSILFWSSVSAFILYCFLFLVIKSFGVWVLKLFPKDKIWKASSVVVFPLPLEP